MNNPYVSFAASKMSNNPKFEVLVSFTDFLGKQHNIVCKSRPALKRANEFLKMFKSESVAINKILAEYPVVKGTFPKKYHSEIKRELASAGFSTVSNYLIGK
jgi:predicted TIM-barrel enzyme